MTLHTQLSKLFVFAMTKMSRLFGFMFMLLPVVSVKESRSEKLVNVLEGNPMRIRDLFKTELRVRAVIQKLKDANEVQLGQDALKIIDRYLEMHDSVLKSLESAGVDAQKQLDEQEHDIEDDLVDEVLVGNAVHIFSLTRRCVNYVDKIVKELQKQIKNQDASGALKEALQSLRTLQSETYWPNVEDVKRAAGSLARMQYTYRLKIEDLLAGKIGTRQTQARMYPEDCQLIAKTRLRQQPALDNLDGVPEFALGIEWLEAGYNASMNYYGEDDEVTKITLDLLIKARDRHDVRFSPPLEGDAPTTFPNEMFFIRKIGTDLSITGRSLRKEEYEALKNRQTGVPQDHFKDKYSPRDFAALCRGDKIDIIGLDDSKKKCYFDSKGDAFYRLLPFKAEFAGGVEPQVTIVYHDMLTEAEVEKIKQDALQSSQAMRPSKVKGFQPSDSRTQVNVWLNETKYPVLAKLSKKLDVLLGLNVAWKGDSFYHEASSEPYQVGAYAPGGIHSCHRDLVDESGLHWMVEHGKRKPWISQRIATIMFYLSDVERGGTSFPNSGVATPAEKGSAVFWYDQYHDSSKDSHYGWHGGCPVLYGIKWVMNKWIRELNQPFKRPCGLKWVTDPDTIEPPKRQISITSSAALEKPKLS